MARRKLATGELESKVLEVLWDAGQALTPGAVHQRLFPERPLAYTTVMTILTRLWNKGVLERSREGRAFAYRPILGRAEHTAQRMREILQGAGSRADALASFVGAMDAKERAQLRRMLGRGTR